MKKTLFITTLLLSAGAMFTSCNKDVENPDMQAQPEETAQVTRAYGDKTPLIEVYYEINDTNPLNALSYEMNGKKFIDLVQLFASNIQKDANGDPCIFFNDKLAPVKRQAGSGDGCEGDLYRAVAECRNQGDSERSGRPQRDRHLEPDG